MTKCFKESLPHGKCSILGAITSYIYISVSTHIWYLLDNTSPALKDYVKNDFYMELFYPVVKP